MLYRLSIVMVIVGLVGCHAGTPPTFTLQWEGNPFGGSAINIIYPIFFEDKVILFNTSTADSLCGVALSTHSGALVWRWSANTSGKGLYYNLQPVVLDSILFLPHGSALQAINLRSGHCEWSHQHRWEGTAYIETDGKYIYRTYSHPDSNLHDIVRIDPTKGVSESLYLLQLASEGMSQARTPVPVSDHTGRSLLVFSSIWQSATTDKRTLPMLHWFDPNSKTLVDQDTIYPVNQTGEGVTKQGVYDKENNALYLVANDALICVDTKTKQQWWTTTMPRDMLSSRLLLHKNALYWPAEDGFCTK
jgi:outer membrane protein assembly factor BamB